MKVTRSVSSYGLEALVVEIGSSLGLWLGLSILGVLQLGYSRAKVILNLRLQKIKIQEVDQKNKPKGHKINIDSLEKV